MDTITYDDFKKLDLRVAEILAVEPHPNADRLWVIKVKIADEQRTIVAGIKQFYKPEELVGKKIVVVKNLAPAVIRGVESQGMMLAASTDSSLAFLTPEKDLPSGAIVK